jgi:hypothetical protein
MEGTESAKACSPLLEPATPVEDSPGELQFEVEKVSSS